MITVIVVFIVDISGFIDSVKKTIWRIIFKNFPYKDYSIKPFDCSLCLTFWIILIYLLSIRCSIINSLFIASIMAFLTGIIHSAILVAKEIALYLLDLITKKLK